MLTVLKRMQIDKGPGIDILLKKLYVYIFLKDIKNYLYKSCKAFLYITAYRNYDPHTKKS